VLEAAAEGGGRARMGRFICGVPGPGRSRCSRSACGGDALAPKDSCARGASGVGGQAVRPAAFVDRAARAHTPSGVRAIFETRRRLGLNAEGTRYAARPKAFARPRRGAISSSCLWTRKEVNLTYYSQ